MFHRIDLGQRYKLNQRIPKEMQHPTSGAHFRKIGIYSPKISDEIVKDVQIKFINQIMNIIYHPWFCLALASYVGIRAIIILSMPKQLSLEQKRILYYFGDISVIINLRYHFNLLLATFVYSLILFQWIHYEHSFKSSKPEWTTKAPFNVFNGKVSPNRIGIRSVHLLNQLVHRANFLFHACHIIRLFLFFGVWLAYFLVLMYRYFQKDFQSNLSLATTIIHSIVYMFFADFFYGFTLYHMLYFYLTCEYIR